MLGYIDCQINQKKETRGGPTSGISLMQSLPQQRFALPAISLKSVSINWAGKCGVVDISIDIAKGELLALIGRTGAGKSTLLRLIAGLDTPEHGLIEIDGQNTQKTPPHLRGISMIFQRNVHYPGRTIAMDWNEAENRGVLQAWNNLGITDQWVIDSLELTDRNFQQKPETLSGGESRRASILRALLQNRPIILADEPLAGLDTLTRDRVARFLWQFVKKTGQTMIVVAHEPVDALGLADRIAVMKSGRLLQTGWPESLLENPDWLEVAQLLHHPPLNDVTPWLVEDFLETPETLCMALPQFCKAIPAEEAEVLKNKSLKFLRNRSANGHKFTEWVDPMSNHVLWTLQPEQQFEQASIVWKIDKTWRFNATTGARVAMTHE